MDQEGARWPRDSREAKCGERNANRSCAAGVHIRDGTGEENGAHERLAVLGALGVTGYLDDAEPCMPVRAMLFWRAS